MNAQDLDGLGGATPQQRALHEAQHLEWWLDRDREYGRALWAASRGYDALALRQLRRLAADAVTDRIYELEAEAEG